MSKHRIILIGHGTISERYIVALGKLPHAEIVGVVGRNEERVRTFAEARHLGTWGTNLAEVAARSGATAAVICTPNAAHAEGVLAAAAQGLHILCEKPLHIDPATSQRMIQACEQQGVKLAVSYMRRFTPHIQAVKAFIDSGGLGRLKVLDVVLKHYRDATYYDSWHGTWAEDGGGPFMQQGSHMIDLANWLGGGYDEVLGAHMFRIAHKIETEDHGYAIIRYRSGAVGMIEASTGCPGTSSDRIELSGERGSIALDFDGILSWEVPGVEPPSSADALDEIPAALFERLCADFLESIQEGRSPYVDGREAAAATELIAAIYAKAGAPQDLVN
ncbi:Gfo/Idh/MocA family protein [Paenibacillus daejeonensis]|uniref:Gfo/Idh/MocA family protein n=1 Tax=Paenibacillus daejeonensis TaxID=135193 RepID=UPI00037719A1|nr:Gfo/Idh/MocA family oxidoreductase [Paenibacillus daejeonensis]